MTAPLASLETALQSFLSAMAGKPPFNAPEKMLAVETGLRNSIPPGAGISPTAVCRGVAAFFASGADMLTRRDVRALCAGLDHSCASCGGLECGNRFAVGFCRIDLASRR